MRTNMRLILLLLACVGLGVLTWLDYNSPAPDFTGPDRAETHLAEVGSIPEDTSETLMLIGEEDDDGGSFADDVQAVTDASQYMIEPETSPSNPLSAIDIATLRDTVTRPLFASSRRRPPESDPQVAEVAVAEPPTFELLGVSLGGPRAIAVLRRKSDGRSYRVEAGDVLAGWQVTEVKAHEVLLKRPEGISLNVPLLRP